MSVPKSIVIDGVEYEQKTKPLAIEDRCKGLRYAVIRADRAGVFAGYVCGMPSPGVIKLYECRRIWYWDGAASISQLAVSGTSKPGNCKFPAPVSVAEIYGVIEVLYCSTDAQRSIQEVPVWSK